jgi:hypothetical protein
MSSMIPEIENVFSPVFALKIPQVQDVEETTRLERKVSNGKEQ